MSLSVNQRNPEYAPLPPPDLQQQFAHVVGEVERIREQQVESGLQIEGMSEGQMASVFAEKLVA
jgi:hypothetical protein